MNRRFVAIALVLLTAVPALIDAQGRTRLRLRIGGTPPVAKNGWWMRVETGATQATSISFMFGTKPNEPVGEGTWQTSTAGEIEFPSEVRAEKVIHLDATATPTTAGAVVCVFYQQDGVERLAFTGTVSRQLNSNKKDAACMP